MADNRYEIDHDGNIGRYDSSICADINKVLNDLFSQFNWSCKIVDQKGPLRKIELLHPSGEAKTIYVFAGNIRNEARNPYEKKIQLGPATDPKEFDKHSTIILGIYVFEKYDSYKDAIFVGYPIDDNIKYETNPSLRGVYVNEILIQAKSKGFVIDKEHNNVGFRSEFVFYYLENFYKIHYEHDPLPQMDPKPASSPNTGIGENILFYGVPGIGKSYKIKTEYCDDDDYMERVVFHPDYSNSDFIGQILPSNINGNISYPFIPGPFTRILKKASERPDCMFYLVIEEINRGNAPAIFGEVFQLLDRVNGESEYGISNADIAKAVYGDANTKVKIPSNLYILATMNTADQNVFTLDTAFKRRWKMVRIQNDFDGCELSNLPIGGTNLTWREFAETINNIIINNNQSMMSSEDKRLGAYFVTAEEITKASLFAEKVLAYLWDDVFKYDREKVFNPGIRTVDQLVEMFVSNNIAVFSGDALQTLTVLNNDDKEHTT